MRKREAALTDEWACNIEPCELIVGEKYFENDPDLEDTFHPDEPDRINKDNFTLAGRAEVRTLNITLIR